MLHFTEARSEGGSGRGGFRRAVSAVWRGRRRSLCHGAWWHGCEGDGGASWCLLQGRIGNRELWLTGLVRQHSLADLSIVELTPKANHAAASGSNETLSWACLDKENHGPGNAQTALADHGNGHKRAQQPFPLLLNIFVHVSRSRIFQG